MFSPDPSISVAITSQVRLVGDITKVSEDISDKYYKSRSRGSRIGAWASKQSRELESREALMEEVRLFESKYTDDIPRPSHWGGFALKPIEFEFWQDSDFRLHDRFILKPTKQNNQWIAKRHAELSISALWPIKNPHHCVVRVILLVEAAGFEPASASPLPSALHA